MSYTTLDSIQWGGTPLIGVSFAYEGQRSGSSMQYRIRVTIDPLTGASYFGYPIYLCTGGAELPLLFRLVRIVLQHSLVRLLVLCRHILVG